VLLSPMELDTTMRMILQVPIWAQRVIYIQGSCLKDGDLARARMNEAEACFVLAARNYADKTAADEHTILRSVINEAYNYRCKINHLLSSLTNFFIMRIKHCNLIFSKTYFANLRSSFHYGAFRSLNTS